MGNLMLSAKPEARASGAALGGGGRGGRWSVRGPGRMGSRVSCQVGLYRGASGVRFLMSEVPL